MSLPLEKGESFEVKTAGSSSAAEILVALGFIDGFATSEMAHVSRGGKSKARSKFTFLRSGKGFKGKKEGGGKDSKQEKGSKK